MTNKTKKTPAHYINILLTFRTFDSPEQSKGTHSDFYLVWASRAAYSTHICFLCKYQFHMNPMFFQDYYKIQYLSWLNIYVRSYWCILKIELFRISLNVPLVLSIKTERSKSGRWEAVKTNSTTKASLAAAMPLQRTVNPVTLNN